jgi:hypothetical protein
MSGTRWQETQRTDRRFRKRNSQKGDGSIAALSPHFARRRLDNIGDRRLRHEGAHLRLHYLPQNDGSGSSQKISAIHRFL